MKDEIFKILTNSIDNSREIKKVSNELIIREDDSGARCKEVKIKTSKKTFCLELDKKGIRLTNVLNPSVGGIQKVNDACIFFIYKNRLYALLIELKSGRAGDYLDQLKSGRNFVEYIIQQLKLFNSSIFGKIDIEYRGVLFRLDKKGVSKQTTSKKNKIVFKDINGLLCTTLTCNQTYMLSQIIEAL